MSNHIATSEKKRICLLNCENHPNWIKYNLDIHDDNFLIECYNVFEYKWPLKTELESFDAFLITGSLSAAYETEELVKNTWVPSFGSFVQELVQTVLTNNQTNSRKQYILGICFGHQIIAHYCGGEGHKMTTPQYGIQPQTIKQEFFTTFLFDFSTIFIFLSFFTIFFRFFELNYVKEALDQLKVKYSSEVSALLDHRATFAPIETHGDEVLRMPTGATLLTTSENTPVESYAIGNYVLCLC